MTSIILAEPSILVGIPGILLILAVVLTIVIGGPLLLILYLVKRHRKPHPSPIPPVQPPSTERLLRKCSKCGSALNPDVPEGLCPACLLQQGIATEAGVPAGQPAFIPPTIPELAKLFPQLEIIEPIGKGGMGAVYKARQPALDRFVALKILAPRPGNELDFGSRFSREARALARLNHPNIVAVYDFGQIGGLSYFIMEYVDGRNLRQVQQAGRLAPREALEIIPQICAALQFAHDEGIVHRDIKPENVLLDRKGRVKIADFGLAKILGQEAQDFRLTGAKDVMGTPHYMAPEQVEKPQEVDHRADIFSLGVVFYEMLTGELPLGKFSPPSQKVQVDVRLDEVVLRALEKEPGRRYQQVSEVRTRLENIAGNPQASGTTPPAFAPANPAPPRRKSLLVTVIVLALVAALVVPA
ncbi:MAG TPA: serine/threonine-protein kinase, partial [Candidatus Paceibacterota bacterium]|nr:serine/threonine-protein kinase [Candidatus Paceibacterota bacterium]